MANDLISKEEVIFTLRKVFEKYNIGFKNGSGGFADAIPKAIESIPIAYDVDKVVEQMEKDTELAYNRYMDCSPNAPQSVVARYSTQYQERKRCLDIVKSGGID